MVFVILIMIIYELIADSQFQVSLNSLENH